MPTHATPSHFPHCPVPPDWALDWQALVQRFAWLWALDGVPHSWRDSHEPLPEWARTA